MSVVGGATRSRRRPAISLSAAGFAAGAPPPIPVRLEAVPPATATAVVGACPTPATSRRTLVLLADPFSFPVDAFLAGLAEQRPTSPCVGGLASAARGPGGNRLVLDGAVHDDGAVGVLLPPGVDDRAVVSPGLPADRRAR